MEDVVTFKFVELVLAFSGMFVTLVGVFWRYNLYQEKKREELRSEMNSSLGFLERKLEKYQSESVKSSEMREVKAMLAGLTNRLDQVLLHFGRA